jgi:hypothetical protein
MADPVMGHKTVLCTIREMLLTIPGSTNFYAGQHRSQFHSAKGHLPSAARWLAKNVRRQPMSNWLQRSS